MQVFAFYDKNESREFCHHLGRILLSNVERAFFLENTGNREQETGGLNWIGEEIRDDTMLQWFPQIGMHSIHDDQIQDRSQQSDYQR